MLLVYLCVHSVILWDCVYVLPHHKSFYIAVFRFVLFHCNDDQLLIIAIAMQGKLCTCFSRKSVCALMVCYS